MMNEVPALVIDSLTVGYGSGPNVIEDVNLNLPAGSLSCLLGDNGAGKSTLLKSIAGLIPFRNGQIHVNGLDCRLSHSRVGYLPQEAGVDWDFPVTVYDVVMMGRVRELGWFRLPRLKDRYAVESALNEVSMQSYRNHPVSDLSVGQRRRVWLARSFAQGADLLLFDEPFTGVDMSTRQELCQTLTMLHRAGFTVIVSSHTYDVNELPYESAILLDGKCSYFGGIEEILSLESATRDPIN